MFLDDRNKKYIGWDAEKLIDKIDEKIEELKDIKKMNGGNTDNVKNNLGIDVKQPVLPDEIAGLILSVQI